MEGEQKKQKQNKDHLVRTKEKAWGMSDLPKTLFSLKKNFLLPPLKTGGSHGQSQKKKHAWTLISSTEHMSHRGTRHASCGRLTLHSMWG